MGRKAVGPVCCVTHVKEPSALIEKVKGFTLVFLVWSAAYCTTAPWNHCRVLCKWIRSHNSNKVPHTLQEKNWMLKHRTLIIIEQWIWALYTCMKPLLLLMFTIVFVVSVQKYHKIALRLQGKFSIVYVALSMHISFLTIDIPGKSAAT